VILFLHNRYRRSGGEERAVADLLWLVREQLGEDAELLERDSALLGRGRAAAGMLRGGLRPEEVARAVRATKARVVHAHNLSPAFGWRALAAAREAGARVVAHHHQYRSVCAVGICFTHGRECTRCHGRNTLPGVIRNCRGGAGEAVVYAAALSLWQRRAAEAVDAAIVPVDTSRLDTAAGVLGDAIAHGSLLQLGAVILNILGTLILVGGSAWSAYRLIRDHGGVDRVVCNVLLTAGAFVIAAGFSAAKLAGGSLDTLGVYEAVGIAVMFAGFLSLGRLRRPAAR